MNEKIKQMLLSSNNAINYTGIFFKDGSHVTWNYGFPLIYPENIQKGDITKIKVIGKYEDEQVACDVIEWEGNKTQPKGTLLHRTTKVQNGGKPVMSGIRATEKGYDKIEPYYIEGLWI